jgi:hypothetical protein
MRERGRVKMRERELSKRRNRLVSEQREQAQERERRAEAAERRARIAEQEAERDRAEARLREERAALHERGMADHELIEDDERDRFAGTSAVPGGSTTGARRARNGSDADDRGSDDDEGDERQRSPAYEEGRRSVHDQSRAEDFEQGCRDEEADGDHGLLGRFRLRHESKQAA